MIKCGIIGATGYTGIELIKILLRHPSVKLTALTTRQKESIPVGNLVPALPASVKLKIRQYSFEELNRDLDLAFLCLPHTEAMETAARLYKAGKIVIDLSADLRLKKAAVYEQWYEVKHRKPELLKKAVYGLPELYAGAISKARLIANPGCYPTGAILGAFPLLKAGLADPGAVVIDSKSGVSGAGKKLQTGTQYYELDENFYAYRVGRHQHTPEIRQVLETASKKKLDLAFVTHLLPVKRGILSTIYLKTEKGMTEAKVAAAFRKAYGDAPFVRMKQPGEFPSLRDVQNTNFCDIGFYADRGAGRVIVVTAIDNLLKGASGQAVQNMNLCLGLPEDEGLISW